MLTAQVVSRFRCRLEAVRPVPADARQRCPARLEKGGGPFAKDAEAHGNLAAVLRAGGRLEEAVASGRRALQIKPDFAGGHNNLGLALQGLGRLA